MIRSAAALLLLVAAPTAALAKERVTVVVTGDPAAAASVRRTLAGASLPVELALADTPNESSLAPRDGKLEEQVARARVLYVDASFAGCLSALDRDAIVRDAVADGRRALAARALFWRIACQVGASDEANAAREAAAFAALGLDVPGDAEAANPEVEAVLARALRAAASSPRRTLRVESTVAADLWIDGHDAGCATPCSVELSVGSHVVRVAGDGVDPAVRVVVVSARPASPSLVKIETAPASPEVAARQWSARYARSATVDSASSLRLLGQAVRARRLILIAVEARGRDLSLRAALAVDGAVAARAQRRRARASHAPDVIGELLVLGQVVHRPPLVSRPSFWIAVGATAVLAATAAFLFVYEPDRTTEVRF